MKNYLKNGIRVAAICLAGAFLSSCSTVQEEPKFKARNEYHKILLEKGGHRKVTGQKIIEAKVEEDFFKISIKDFLNNTLLEMTDYKPYPKLLNMFEEQKDLPFDGIDKVRVYINSVENPRYEDLNMKTDNSYFKELEKTFDDLAFKVVEEYKEDMKRLQEYEERNKRDEKTLQKHINSILEEIEKQQ